MGRTFADETVTVEIVRSGLVANKKAALRYLQSVSARAEAELVNVSDIAQGKIISAIGRLSNKELQTYELQKTIQSINTVLGKMISDCESLSLRMIAANVIAGKLKAVISVPLRGDDIISAVTLNDSDKERIEKMLSENMEHIRHGASLTLQSVNTMLQNAAVRMNIPRQGWNEEAKAGASEKIEQDPISSEFEGMAVTPRVASRKFVETMPSAIQLEAIKSNPLEFVKRAVDDNIKAISEMRTDYSERKANNERVANAKTKVGVVTGMVRELLKNGVSAFTDKGGKRWSLINYCSMTARTVSTKSNNVGEVFADDEHDLYYIVPHSHSCPLCKKVEGRVYSRSGRDKRFPPLASVFSKIDPYGTDDLDNTYMTIHPNCRHKIVRYVEKKHTGRK